MNKPILSKFALAACVEMNGDPTRDPATYEYKETMKSEASQESNNSFTR